MTGTSRFLMRQDLRAAAATSLPRPKFSRDIDLTQDPGRDQVFEFPFSQQVAHRHTAPLDGARFPEQLCRSSLVLHEL